MQLNHIKYDQLLKFADGDIDFVKDMLTTFVNNTPENIENIRNFYKSSDWHKLSVELHKIKPTYKYLFVKSVENLLRSSEELCEQNPTGMELRSNLDAIEDITQKVIEEANYLLQHPTPPHS